MVAEALLIHQQNNMQYISSILLFFAVLVAVNSRKIHIQIRENVTQSCPNVDSDIIDESSLKISMKLLKNDDSGEEDEEKDEVTITEMNGETRQIDFPGCYRVKVSFKMLRAIENPYVEAFMQLGQNVPCKSEGQNLRGVASICANVTRPDQWCPQSYNSQLNDMLGDKSTCKFCSVCEKAKDKTDSKLEKIQKFISNEGKEECTDEDGLHRYTFKMCTPTKDDLNKEESSTREKIEEYWQYLKQVKMHGIMTTVIHVMDRSPMKVDRAVQCQKMCQTLSDNSMMVSSSSYRQTLEKSIEKLCAPVDTYAACLFHSVKFDVNSN